jgi:hypothetical protein
MGDVRLAPIEEIWVLRLSAIRLRALSS